MRIPFRSPLWVVVPAVLALLVGPAGALEMSEETRSLFPPYLQVVLPRLPGPLTVSLLRGEAESLQKKFAGLKSKSQPSFGYGLLLNEQAALDGLIESVLRWESTPIENIPGLLDAIDARSNDLSHIRGSRKMLKELALMVGYVDLSEDKELKRKLVAGLDARIASFPKDPSTLASVGSNRWEGGDFSGPDDPRRGNYEARDAAFLLALRYHLTGQVSDAEKVGAILLRFGEVMPEWEFFTRGGQAFSAALNGPDWFSEYRARRGDNGLFGIWYHLELTAALPLAKAYALTAQALPEDERDRIQTSVLDFIVNTLERFPFPGTHNLAVFHLEGLLSWGRLLGKPEYVHKALRIYDKLVLQGFYPDGYWNEFTTDYHRQVLGPLAYTIPAIMEGYSDPEGYRGGKDGRRYEDLHLREEYRLPLQQSLDAMVDTVLPDGSFAAISDTEAGVPCSFSLPQEFSQPRLLGAAGLAILGQGKGPEQSELFLLYKGTLGGHRQEDALSILWYAHGLEVLSETTYRGPKESYKYRGWYRSASAHNTVVVDERPQYFQAKRFSVPSEDLLWEGAGATTNQGKLLVFDPTLPEAQFVEAEFVRAYHPVVSRFQRTVSFVPMGNGDGYLVDIFRVKGGKKHDYIIRGGLDQAYEVTLSLPKMEMKERLYDHIQVHSEYELNKAAVLNFKHANGVNLSARILDPIGSGAVLLEGDAPAIRREGTAAMFLLRNQTKAKTSGPLDSTFVLVYDVSRGASSLKSARIRPVPGNTGTVVVEVEWGDHRDILLSSTTADADLAFDDLHFRGQLGFLRYRAGEPVLAHLSSQGELSVTGKFDLKARASDTGIVEQGSSDPLKNEPLTLDHAPELSRLDKIVHVDLGEAQRFSYPIVSLRDRKLQTAYPAGFQVDGQGFKMNRAPGWKGAGPLRWEIPHPATWRRSTNLR